VRVGLADQHRQQRIAPQWIGIVQVFAAQRQPEHLLAPQLFDRVLHTLFGSMIHKASRKLSHDPGARLHRAQQPTAPVGADLPAVKLRHHLPSSQGVKSETGLCALRLQKAASFPARTVSWNK